MQDYQDYDEINTASHPEYFPFQGNPNFKYIFFSARYLPLLESYLCDNNIDYNVYDYEELQYYNICLPEYRNHDVIKINVKTPPPSKFIYSHSDKIFIKKNISVETLYDVLCSSYYANNWYHELSDITFKSVLIDLTPADIRYLIARNFVVDSNQGLLYRIDNGIKQLIDGRDRVFVKLYSVSPKNDSSLPIDLTARNSLEVVELLTKSKRTYNSLHDNIVCGIMLREYIPDIDPDNEFRLFVFGNNLRAISQYKCYDIIPKYQDASKREHVYETICEWWSRVENKFHYRDFVLDIVYLDDHEIKMIEINSYGPGLLSGSALYNWLKDYDILHNSSKPDIRFVLADNNN